MIKLNVARLQLLTISYDQDACRRPGCYGLLISMEVQPPFVRPELRS